MFGTWVCLTMPWHHFVSRKRLSRQSEQITCSCGRKYAMNHDVRAFLPWDEDFDQLYADIDRMTALSTRDKTSPDR